MMITIFLFSHAENFFIPFMCNKALFHLRLWLRQHFFSRVLAKRAAPLATASSWNSLGTVTLNQIKGETKTTQNTPDKPILPLFTVLLCIQGRCLVWLKAQLCKELCPDSQTQEGTAGTGGASGALLLLLKLNLVSDHNELYRVLQPPVAPAPVLHTCTHAMRQRNWPESVSGKSTHSWLHSVFVLQLQVLLIAHRARWIRKTGVCQPPLLPKTPLWNYNLRWMSMH